MEWLNEASVVILGVVLRLAIPLGITIVLVSLFKRLDERWQKEGQKQAVSIAKNTGCWDVNHCSEEAKAKCQAYAHPDSPCWQVFRSQDGKLQERCLDCKVFENAPMPVRATVQVRS